MWGDGTGFYSIGGFECLACCWAVVVVVVVVGWVGGCRGFIVPCALCIYIECIVCGFLSLVLWMLLEEEVIEKTELLCYKTGSVNPHSNPGCPVSTPNIPKSFNL